MLENVFFLFRMVFSVQKMRFPLYNNLWALKIQYGGQFPMVNVKSSEVIRKIVAKIGKRVFLVPYGLLSAKNAFSTLQQSVGSQNPIWRTISYGKC
jgi:hypothetical protein